MGKYKKIKGRNLYRAQVKIGYYDNGNPKYKQIYAKTQAELENKVAEFKYNLNNGIIIDNKTPLGEWADEWMKIYKADVSYNTKEMYLNIINNYIHKQHIDRIPLIKIKTSDLQNIVNEIINEGHHSTAQKFKLTVKQILESAVENDMIIKNNAKYIKLPPITKKPKSIISDMEEEAIKNAKMLPSDRLFLFLGLYAGLRKGEILALTKNDINFKKNTITINKTVVFKENVGEIKYSPKTNAGYREIPIFAPLKSILEDFLSDYNNLLIFTTKDKTIMTRSAARRMWERIIRCLNDYLANNENYKNQFIGSSPVIKFTPHILRHTFATNLAYAGIDIKSAQKILGHSSVNVTLDIYTHIKLNNNDIENKMNEYITKQNISK